MYDYLIKNARIVDGTGSAPRSGDVAIENGTIVAVGDAEGMEADVLAGGEATIRRLRPWLYVENDRKNRSAALIGLINSFGYRLYWHLPPYYNPANFFANKE